MKKLKKLGTLFVLIISFVALGGLKASAGPLDLSEEQKLDYYKQYEEIVRVINSGEPSATLELGSFEDFSDEDFVTPSEFREYAIERSNWKFNIVSDSDIDDITPFNTVRRSKSKTVDSNGADVSVTITGTFTTQYYDLYQRHLFSGASNITTSASRGTWTTTGMTSKLIDMGTTYEIQVGGRINLNNLTSNHNVTIEFYCTANGSVE